MHSLNFSGRAGEVLEDWYAGVLGNDSKFYFTVGERVELRRANNQHRIQGSKAYARIAKALGIDVDDETSHDSFSWVIYALAVCHSPSDKRLGSLIPESMPSSRIERIIRASRRKTAAYYVRSVINQLEKVPVKDVADLIYWWGKSRSQRFARDYYYAQEETGNETGDE